MSRKLAATMFLLALTACDEVVRSSVPMEGKRGYRLCLQRAISSGSLPRDGDELNMLRAACEEVAFTPKERAERWLALHGEWDGNKMVERSEEWLKGFNACKEALSR